MNIKKPLIGVAAILSTFQSMGVLAEDTYDGIPLRAPCHVEGAEALQTRIAEHTKSEREIMDLERLSCRMLGNPQSIGKAIDFIVAKNGRLLLDGAGIANSAEAQAAMFKAYMEAGFNIEYEPFEAVVSKSDDMAWALGLVKETKPNGATEIAKYVSVWHRIDGQWKNVIEMRNSNGGLPLTP